MLEGENPTSFTSQPASDSIVFQVSFFFPLNYFGTATNTTSMLGVRCPQCGYVSASKEETRYHLKNYHGGWWPRLIKNFGELELRAEEHRRATLELRAALSGETCVACDSADEESESAETEVGSTGPSI